MMELPLNEALEILYKGHPDYETISDEIYDIRRWSVEHELIVRNIKEDKYYRAFYSQGATEYQDIRPWYEQETVTFREVKPYQKTITAYK